MLFPRIPSKYKNSFSNGIWRFYELKKYITIEDNLKKDECEGKILFDTDKMPEASFKGLKFKFNGIKPDEKYLSQYFILCFSKERPDFIEGYEILEIKKSDLDFLSNDFFPKGMLLLNDIVYYDEWSDVDFKIHPMHKADQCRYIFHKKSIFKDENEFRTALFLNNSFANEIKTEGCTLTKQCYPLDRKSFEFNITLSSGEEDDGYKYIELKLPEI